MKMEYDKEADAAYIYLAKKKIGGVAKTGHFSEEIKIDFGFDDKLYGIEVLGASKRIKKEELEKAEPL